MDPMMEAYRNVQKASKNTLTESVGARHYNTLNKALLEFYNIRKELKEYDVNAEVLDGMYGAIQKIVEDWKKMIQDRTISG